MICSLFSLLNSLPKTYYFYLPSTHDKGTRQHLLLTEHKTEKHNTNLISLSTSAATLRPPSPPPSLPMSSWWVLLNSWHHFWGRWLTILVSWEVTSQPSSRFITCHSCVTWSLTQEDWVPRRPSSRNTNLSRFADTPGSRMLWNFSKKHLFSGGHWLWFSLLGKCRNPETEAAENAAESQNVGKLSCSNNNFWPVWW